MKLHQRYRVGWWIVAVALGLWAIGPGVASASPVSASATLSAPGSILLSNPGGSAALVSVSVGGDFYVSVGPPGSGSATIDLVYSAGGPPLISLHLATTGGPMSYTGMLAGSPAALVIGAGGSVLLTSSEMGSASVSSSGGSPPFASAAAIGVRDVFITSDAGNTSVIGVTITEDPTITATVTGSSPPVESGFASADVIALHVETTSGSVSTHHAGSSSGGLSPGATATIHAGSGLYAEVTSAIPEPASALLAGIGCISMITWSRLRRRK